MKKFKKVIALAMAAMTAISAMSMSAMAAETPDVEFENSSHSASSASIANPLARSNDTYNYEVWVYWNYDDSDCPEAYELSLIDQEVYRISSRIRCKNSDSSVITSSTSYARNDTCCYSDTVQATTEQCVMTGTGTFQATSGAEIWTLNHVQRLPED